MMTRQTILHQLNAYLNHGLTLAELVGWAENALIEPDIPDDEDAAVLMDIVMYLGAADSRGFPLTWEVLSDFLTRLGSHARVILQTA